MVFHFSHEQVEATAGALDTGAESLRTELTTLLGKVEDLLGEGFVTEVASERFGEGYRELNSGIDTAVNGINEMAQGLRQKSASVGDFDATGI
ncbi:WXG100 family type VII secretion target [Paramicrobacterium agarici]|uniref:WXG100 family type VII secretion target n=1 Tax=Paramicrobacterium agarici TaxID=630514 RepID=UPI001152E408|nr:WXG100 family type VII secretion target [Microbacterium agarici]TQO23364.1 type VII secretion system (Wss) protein ESAT-6 [Microbacterium agarici]